MPINERGQWIRTTHRDRVFAAIKNTPWRMVRIDQEGRENKILDPNNEKVGGCTFDSKLDFMGASLMGEFFVKGRIMNKHEALSAFITKIEEYGAPH